MASSNSGMARELSEVKAALKEATQRVETLERQRDQTVSSKNEALTNVRAEMARMRDYYEVQIGTLENQLSKAIGARDKQRKLLCKRLDCLQDGVIVTSILWLVTLVLAIFLR